jgi:hypothetical protein
MAQADVRPSGSRFVLRPQESADAAAVLAFNQRLMASGRAVPFLLNERGADDGARVGTHYLLTQDDVVRGGVLAVKHSATVAGKPRSVMNIQSPLTEAVADQRYATLSVWMFRELQRQFGFVYAVGMGGIDRPLPRLLASLKWRVELVPFRFVPLRPDRVASMPTVLARIPAPLRPPAVHLTRLLGAPYRALLRLRSSGRLHTDDPSKAAPFMDAAWAGVSPLIAFGIDRVTADQPRLFSGANAEEMLRVHGIDDAFAVVRTRVLGSASPFAGMRVATLLELVAPSVKARQALSRQVIACLADRDVDIAVGNFSLPEVLSALDGTGWLRGPSNYVAALSPAFEAAGVSVSTSYITRTDGDGRLNL